jgi:hypothetical protein
MDITPTPSLIVESFDYELCKAFTVFEWVGWQVQVSGLMIWFIQNSPPYLEDSHRQLRGSEELPRKWVRREREGQGEGETER